MVDILYVFKILGIICRNAAFCGIYFEYFAHELAFNAVYSCINQINTAL
jgi:hypothetical protein